MLSYNWKLSETKFEKDERYVFSCFSCGGGSTMGYKLAGFQVVGCNEIDPKMMECYIANHNPKFPYLCDIREFVKMARNKELAKGLYDLDILDGSPPCSSFSAAGNGSKDWGKEKIFREGQSKQVLDTLFFDFIELSSILRPKIVIAENVKGLLQGDAIKYVRRIYKEFDEAGYYCQHHLLDSSKMGVPQRRERVFFIAVRKDIRGLIPISDISILNQSPYLDLRFNEKEIKYGEFADYSGKEIGDYAKKAWDHRKFGDKTIADSKLHAGMKVSDMNTFYVFEDSVCNTLTSKGDSSSLLFSKPLRLGKSEFSNIGTFPQDYNFCSSNFGYLIGMSVPPLMTYGLVNRIKEQWLPYIPVNENFMDFLWG